MNVVAKCALFWVWMDFVHNLLWLSPNKGLPQRALGRTICGVGVGVPTKASVCSYNLVDVQE